MMLRPEAPSLPGRLISRATILPDREAIPPLLPKAAVIAEVGVGFGDFSAVLLQTCRPRHFLAIDNFELHKEKDLWGRTPAEVFGTGTHRDAYETRFADRILRGDMRTLAGHSADCLALLPDRSVDVFYIDADYRYEFVKPDLELAGRKIRDDGWIIVNDYIMVPTLRATIPYGVVNATHELC